jgi:hypothetical protein
MMEPPEPTPSPPPLDLPRNLSVEPFFLRCETCQARLRVRDERFLGQIQSCPKCGSMVQIIAPAGWLAQADLTQEAPPELTEVAAATVPSAAASAVEWLRGHAVATAIGVSGLIAVGGLVALLALRGEEQVAALATPSTAVETPVDEPAELVTEVVGEMHDNRIAAAEPDATNADAPAALEEAEAAPAPEQSAAQEETADSTSAFLPLITPPAVAEAETTQPESEPQEARKLTLEPVAAAANSLPPQPPADVADYPPAVETETPAAEVEQVAATDSAADESKLPSLDPPTPRTNLKDQLAMPIESINMPAMPIGDFVSLMSGMTAVPIELDAKVLGEVGLSTRSTVTVHGEATTAGKLLARVLKDHQLTCVERDGALVVVRAKR